MKYIGYFLLFFLSFGIALASIRFLDFEAKGILLEKGELVKSNLYLTFFYLHIIPGMIALMSGPFQFIPKLRNRYLNAHRKLGKVYVLACVIAGIAGFVIAYFATGGWIASLGFMSMAATWLFFTIKAWTTIRKKDIPAHQAWMIRSFAVTLAAVTLRIWIPIFIGIFGMEFIESYVIISWLSWVPNIFVANWIIKRNGILIPKGDLQST